MFLKHFVAILIKLSALRSICYVQAQSSSQWEEAHSQINRIETLDEHCVRNVCSDFYYYNVSDVAYFDLKPEVRIMNDATYDLNNARQYDTLIFENSTFAHFPLHLFYSMTLNELDLRNCSVELVTWENFIMADKLKILLLSNNLIREIPEMTFNYATNLQFLFLDSNRIHTLVNESFKGLVNLHYLDLQHNHIRVLPTDLFHYMPTLRELNLHDNHLYVISNEHFAHNNALLSVTLSNNRLRDIAEHAFEAQQNLMLLDSANNAQLEVLVLNLKTRHLYAANCSLYRVNIYGSVANADLSSNQILELYFSQPETLETLNLRQNSLQQIASLTRASNLRTLDLSDNPQLGNLPDPWHLNSVQRLNLANTSITKMSITTSSLSSSSKQTTLPESQLKFLNVSNNKLRELDPLSFQHFESLNYFYIHANDWNCFNLRLIMDILIRPNGIIYVPDVFDPEFPGEYIHGIACMYRIEQDEEQEQKEKEQQKADNAAAESFSNENYVILSEQSQMNPFTDTQNIRQEFKVLANFYEQKFALVLQRMSNLEKRLKAIERLAQINETQWQQMSIMVN